MNLIIGIDATNLRAGGGVTHLIELLRAAEPENHGITKMVIWSGRKTLDVLDDRPWLEKVNPPELNAGLAKRMLWQRTTLSSAAKARGCDVLFVPGGSYAGTFRPFVTMSQNMLPFEWRELKRYGWSMTLFRLLALRWVQSRSFRTAEGVIFLTQYAKSGVERVIGVLAKTIIIPHGVNPRFLMPPKPQKYIENCASAGPFRILYVSIIDQYKHQWHVVEAVARLRKTTGWNVILDLVGPAYPPSLRRLQGSAAHLHPANNWIKYHGPVSFAQLHDTYRRADIGLFASSCETFGIILIETMAAGLPVVCSNRGPMPEVLGEAGIYFDPESPQDIAAALHKLIVSPDLRAALSSASFAASKQYTWERCADATFAFLASVHRDYTRKHPSCVV